MTQGTSDKHLSHQQTLPCMLGQQQSLDTVPTAGDDDPPQLRESFESSPQLQQKLTVLFLKESRVPQLFSSPPLGPSAEGVCFLPLQQGLFNMGCQDSSLRQHHFC